jgi:hypothetical protein
MISGGGYLDMDLMPGFDAVTISTLVPSDLVDEIAIKITAQTATSMTIVNNGQTTIKYIRLNWRVK